MDDLFRNQLSTFVNSFNRGPDLTRRGPSGRVQTSSSGNSSRASSTSGSGAIPKSSSSVKSDAYVPPYLRSNRPVVSAKENTPNKDWRVTPGPRTNIDGTDPVPIGLRESSYGGNYGSSNSRRGNGRDNTLPNEGRGRRSGRRNDRRGNDFTNNENQSEPTKPTLILGYKFLESTSTKDPNEVIMEITRRKAAFLDLIKDKNSMTNDFIVLSVKILARLCEATFNSNKSDILTSVCKESFIDILKSYITQLPFESERERIRNREYWMDPNIFWTSLLTFYKAVIDLLPSTACDAFSEIICATENSISNIITNKKFNLSQKFIENFEHIQQKFTLCLDERIKKETPKEFLKEEEYDAPPEDFRTISVFPTSIDILYREAPFLRPNIIKGAYVSVEHYLDVQFRLLREDFVCPLREGIDEYLNANQGANYQKRRLNTSIRFYKGVKFIGPQIKGATVGIIVDFEAGNREEDDKKKKWKQKINWEHSKRLIYGSLLCFTSDNFNTVFFGTVADRNVKDLEKGLLVVKMSEEENNTPDLYTKTFLMAENEVYFEPYYHVLKALQRMQESNFPMKKYIVDVQSETTEPLYVILRPGLTYRLDGYRIPVSTLDAWPNANALKLNTSQYHAFQTALTKEFAVIQGPPGTGKTFLGLKITSVLLKNIAKPRILVVCYTNHALDQFLEGLMKCTQSIIRIGNQSKNPALAKFNLREHRKNKTKYSRAFRTIYAELEVVMRELKSKQNVLDMINANEGIIDMKHNHNAIELVQKTWLPKAPLNFAVDMSKMSHWLLGSGSIVPQKKKNLLVESVDLKDEIDGYEEDCNVVPAVDESEINFDDIDTSGMRAFQYDVSLKSLEKALHNYDVAIEKLKERNDLALLNEINKLEKDRHEHLCVLQHLEYRMQEGESLRNLPRNTRSAAALNFDERWSLYWFWVRQLKAELHETILTLNKKYREIHSQYDELKQIEDIGVLENAEVIGMTTTSSARLQSQLQSLRIPIVVIEEAAEVTESHIVVALTTHCQHLILIGDHQQLRPSTSVYKLAKKYKLDISLFERMLNNGVHCARLSVQHRMRPEICSLITPTIYENLENHESVIEYPRIKGITKSLFFITHGHYEDPDVGDNVTRKNLHEAKFIIQLCRYLILQGYEGTDITILTTYTGQMFLLRTEKKKFHILNNVKVTVVDNYQGEENKIILLSLVRSNEENKIGFLATENRVCVALSRAKEGFYIIGNMDCLTASSTIWPKVKESLVKIDSLDTHLTLQCQMHLSHFTRVCKADDFNQVPEGGCNQLCDSQLLCGHKCTSVCHIKDRNHEEYSCKEKCPRSCVRNHPCKKMCYEDCGKCHERVLKTLPCQHQHLLYCYQDPETFRCCTMVGCVLQPCGHNIQKKCYEDISTVKCTVDCEDRLPCGHTCIKKCHKLEDPDHLKYSCTKPCPKNNKDCSQDHKCGKMCNETCSPCEVPVKKTRSACTHVFKVKCSEDVEQKICFENCKRMLPCGHFCKLKCNNRCGNCQVNVTKTIPECGHTLILKCFQEPVISNCTEKCKKVLQCGHPCTKKCKELCTEQCEVKVKSNTKAVCGHTVTLPCYLLNKVWPENSSELLQYCDAPCNQLLQCGHVCSGTCSECLQGRIHQPCQERCGNPLICQHSCEVPCREVCPPCQKQCTYRCEHSKCPKKCGEPCKNCAEQCTWACKHKKCTKLCGEICDREPCQEPCLKILPCNHPCIGFCGEKCPKLCRICNEEVTEIFFGNEDEEDARFVELIDCGHVLEASGLEAWFRADDAEDSSSAVKMKLCPLCKTPVMKTLRYANLAKKVFMDVHSIKLKIFGKPKENATASKNLHDKVMGIVNDSIALYAESPTWKRLCNNLLVDLKPEHRNKRQMLSAININAIRNIVDIISQIYKIYIEVKDIIADKRKPFILQINKIVKSLLQVENKITNQQIEDINLELSRTHWIVQLCKIEASKNYNTLSKDPKVINLHNKCKIIAYSIQRFTRQRAMQMEQPLKELAKFLDWVVTEEERRMIVAAMGFKQGHWYKCRNGHIYCIADCGGPVIQAKCPECKTTIGGTGHLLVAGNTVASDMDGARMPAWPTALNRGY